MSMKKRKFFLQGERKINNEILEGVRDLGDQQLPGRLDMARVGGWWQQILALMLRNKSPCPRLVLAVCPLI